MFFFKKQIESQYSVFDWEQSSNFKKKLCEIFANFGL